MIAIKEAVDADRRPGRFIVTGSADVLTLPKVTESLAGRMERHTLWPLAQGEIDRREPQFLEHLFAGNRPPRAEQVTRGNLINRLLHGGYPEAVQREDDERRTAWLANYFDALIQRDLRSIADVKHLDELPRVVRIIASAAPGTVNLNNVSLQSGIPRSSLDRYVALLTQIYVLVRLPAWSANVGTQQVRASRMAIVDSALMAYLLGVTRETLKQWDATRIGGLLENFVAMELVKEASWTTHGVTLFHWRSTKQHEVDLVLQDRDGRVAAIEVKAAASVDSSDFSHLRRLREVTGERWVQGVVLHTGSTFASFGEGLAAWPVSALWTGDDWNEAKS